MAPKLPPPANTKAVFAGLAWLGTDKPRSLPDINGQRITHATFARIYSSPTTHGVIKNVCCVGRLSVPDAAAKCGSRLCGATPNERCTVSGTRKGQRSTNAFSI